jgi:transcription elongation factor GreA
MGDKEMVYQIVTTMRADALQGRITRESPVGQVLIGRHAGETVHVQVSAAFGYDLEIVSIQKQDDDGSIPINAY